MVASIREREVFVGLFDILGFRDLVNNNQLYKVAETYKKAKGYFHDGIGSVNRLQKHSQKKDRVKYRVFSDTFLIHTTGTNDNCFLSMLAACDFLFMAAVEYSLPIRGSVSRGPLMSSGGVEIGRSIVEAYENEKKQDWIGCWISDNCSTNIDMAKYIADKSIVQYEIPLKGGEVKRRLAFNWVKSVSWKVMFKNQRNDFTIEQIKEAISFTHGPSLEWEIRRKIDNTSRFIDFVLSPEFVKEYKSGEV